MPNFRIKPARKTTCNPGSIATLDSKHREFIDKFEREDTVIIPDKEARIEVLRAAMKATTEIEERLDMKDEISKLQRAVRSLKLRRQKYYLDNSKHIFEYFEDKRKISVGNTDNVTRLNKFFNIESSEEADAHTLTDHTNDYLVNIDDSFMNMDKYVSQASVCRACRSGELVPVDHEGVVVCNERTCGKQFRFLIENEKPSYKEPPKEVCFYAYKRINHFREILAQFQAKETTNIPIEVMDNIRAQIKKERIELSAVTNKKAKDILKKLGYNKFYEHIPFIKDKLGIRPPVMTPDLEDRLCSLFIEIQRPYAKYCPDDRVNFLNYYYTIYKLCELLGQTQFLDYFPMLKDREKRIEQDDIWRKICIELNWEFVPTI
jgi:hypothetical protein